MDVKDAVIRYQFGERAKSALIVTSQMVMTVTDYKDAEKNGAKRMLLTMMGSVRSELQFARNTTGDMEFEKAVNFLNEAISLVESDDYVGASEKIGLAISAGTTVAQQAWHVLSDHGIL
jgi:hypothetical protein